MDTTFITIVQKLVSEQGKESLLNAARCKAILADYTRGEYKKESRLILQALEAGAAKVIDSTQELQICKQQQVRLLQDDYFLAEAMAAEVVDVLAFVLRGDASKTPINANAALSIDSKEFEIRMNKLFDEEKLHDVISECNKVIGLEKENGLAYRFRAIAYSTLQEFDKAKNDIDEAIRLNPEDGDSFFARGIYLQYVAEDEKNALKDYDTAFKFRHNLENKKISAIYNQRGIIYSHMNDYGKAITEFEEAIKLTPDNGEIYNDRGDVYSILENTDKAIADYTEAIRLNPDYSQAYYNRGIEYYRLESYDEAIKDYTEAIRLSPDADFAYFNRGSTYFSLGEIDKAIADINAAIKLDPSNDEYREALKTIEGETKSSPKGNPCFNCIYIRDLPEGESCAHPDRHTLSLASGNCRYWSNTPEDWNFWTGKQKKSDCFITTAVCDSFSKPDDCYELTQFRNFRDNWLLAQPDGKQIVERYYRIAPSIVNAINTTPDKQAVYSDIWNKYLVECLRLIEGGRLEECKAKYMEMVETLERKYL
jgi:tetratricopeptide (TPR) repeat protein